VPSALDIEHFLFMTARHKAANKIGIHALQPRRQAIAYSSLEDGFKIVMTVIRTYHADFKLNLRDQKRIRGVFEQLVRDGRCLSST